MTALRSALMAIVLVPAISVTGAAAAGPATVNSVQSLSPAGGDAHAPHVAIDGKGNALVVWSRSNGFHSRIQLRRRYAAGSLGPVQTLSAPGQDALESQIAIDAKGNAIVVWTRFDGHRNRIQLRRRSTSGSLSPVQTLSAQFTDAAQPQVAIDGDGNALVVWTGSEGGGDSRIQLRRRSAAGILGPITNLSIGGNLSQGGAGRPQLAVDANGNSLVAWERNVGTNHSIQLRRRSASGLLGPVQTLSSDAHGPQLAIDGAGNALIVWSREVGTKERVELRRRSNTGSLSAVQTLSALGGIATGPQLAINGNGNALVTWQHHLGDLRWSIQARRRSKTGSLNGVQTLSPLGFTAARQRMAFDAAGNALVIWQLCDGSNCSIQLRRRAPSGDLGSVQTLSASGPRAFDPPVAIAAKRSALAVWSAYDGTNFRIQAVRPAD